jgi:hypothetical protein
LRCSARSRTRSSTGPHTRPRNPKPTVAVERGEPHKRRKFCPSTRFARCARFPPPPSDGTEFNRDQLLSLLSVYTTQLASYTTLLWQVPALGLAAQAFLMTIALGALSASSDGSKYAAASLSMIIALSSMWLMHTQRARAINQSELAGRVSQKLALRDLLGEFSIKDAVPKRANAENVWVVNHRTYGVWIACMGLFIAIDATVILSIVAGADWFT